MAYFDCIVGGSGKGNTLVVTCADDLAGATITCTNGTKTYTKTCPSTSPYEVTFYGLMAGTWTVSATVSGNTYTTTVVVVDCAALLGGFNWRTWVDTARFLDSTDYNSLDEVLADELAVRELCLEHACVDYLAAVPSVNAAIETVINNDLFAKWVNNSDYSLDTLGANVAIKALMDTADKYFYGEWVITDNTTTPPTWGAKGNVPVMTANNAPYGTASAYQVFDGKASTTASGTDFSYKFVNPICPKDFYCNVSGGTLQASNDGSTWSVPTSGSYYLYLRLHFASSVSPHTIQFYGRELSVSVPTMTSNTAPYGEATANKTIYGSGYAYKAFNNDSTKAGSCTLVYNASMSDGRVHYKFTSAKKILMAVYKTFSTSDNSRVKSARIVYSDDGTTWENASEVITFSASQTVIPINISEPHLYWGIGNIINGGNTGNVFVSELQFYGLDYSEKEFEEGTTKKWLYDHGVELETINVGSSVSKEDTQILCSGNSTDGASTVASTNNIDLSQYALLRAVIGNMYVRNDGSAGAVFVSNSDTIQWNSNTWLAYKTVVDIVNPYSDVSVDITSITQSKKVAFGAGAVNLRRISIKELWLE